MENDEKIIKEAARFPCPEHGIVSVAGGTKGSYSTLSNTSTSPLLTGVNSFRSDKDSTPVSNPKAYLNYIALDDQFNYDASASGARPVGGPDVLHPLTDSMITIKKNGYLYIYLTNETKNVSVFFDNLTVTHYAGPMLEENHYYPGGLTMAGISDKALKTNYAENKYRFNDGTELANKEFADGSGLEMYETTFRGYDPQLGRFSQIDPMASAFFDWSPYQFAYDNPVGYNDPLGADVVPATPPGPCVACDFPTIDPNSFSVVVRPEEFGRNDPTEDQVDAQIHANNYEGAFNTAYDAFGDLNKVPKKDFTLSFVKLDLSKKLIRNSGAETDKQVNGGPNLVTFYTNYWDQVFSGMRSYGWLIKSIYHELTHVMQYQSLFGMRELPYNEAEFQSNYMTVMNKNLPHFTVSETNFYVRAAITYLNNDPDRKNLLFKYRVQVQNLLKEVDDNTRKFYISDMLLTNTGINFH